MKKVPARALLAFAALIVPAAANATTGTINAVQTIAAGTYTFAIKPFGNDHQVAGNDYFGFCELTITAYAGMGASIDVGVNPADLSDTDK